MEARSQESEEVLAKFGQSIGFEWQQRVVEAMAG
jgi:hypothetical protein